MATDPVSTCHATPFTSFINSGWPPSRANDSILCCSSATFSGFLSARFGLLSMAANQLHCIVAEQLSRVALFLDELVVSVPIRFPVRRMSKIVDLPEYWSVLIVEPALARPVLAISVSQVPLADNGGLVANFLQRLRQ